MFIAVYLDEILNQQTVFCAENLQFLLKLILLPERYVNVLLWSGVGNVKMMLQNALQEKPI